MERINQGRSRPLYRVLRKRGLLDEVEFEEKRRREKIMEKNE